MTKKIIRLALYIKCLRLNSQAHWGAHESTRYFDSAILQDRCKSQCSAARLMLLLSALSVRLKSNITADPLSKGKSGLGRERERERELKVSAADSAEEYQKLKCLAISVKRVNTPVSTHLNVSDDLIVIHLSAHWEPYLLETQGSKSKSLCFHTLWVKPGRVEVKLGNFENNLGYMYSFQHELWLIALRRIFGKIQAHSTFDIMSSLIYQKRKIKRLINCTSDTFIVVWGQPLDLFNLSCATSLNYEAENYTDINIRMHTTTLSWQKLTYIISPNNSKYTKRRK